ncbi:MAG: hypothetical protein R2844_22775 [Caldilineales bacterium]
MKRAAAVLLMLIFVAAFVGPASVANAGSDAQRPDYSDLTAAMVGELVSRFAAGAELTIPARGERYVGTAEISRYLGNTVPEGRTYSLVSADETANGFRALVTVSDRGVLWARMTLDASVSGTELTRLEVTGIRLLLWQG